MMRPIAARLLVFAGLLLGATATEVVARTPSCAGGMSVSTHLYFGTRRADNGEVSEADWDGFVGEVVAGAFASGFTVLNGKGYWRPAAGGPLISERSIVIVRIHKGTAKDHAAIDRVVTAYKVRFGQSSVLEESEPVCAKF